MLPTDDAVAVSKELAKRFGLPLWQFTVSATDANRHAIRYSRLITGKSKVIVIDRCYHGSVDETFATLDKSGKTVAREGNIGAPVPLDKTTTGFEGISDTSNIAFIGTLRSLAQIKILSRRGIIWTQFTLPIIVDSVIQTTAHILHTLLILKSLETGTGSINTISRIIQELILIACILNALLLSICKTFPVILWTIKWQALL